MRETTFEKPTVRRVLEKTKAELPEKVRDRDVISLINKGQVKLVEDYRQAVSLVDSLGDNEIALFSNRFYVTGEEANQGIKSLEYLVKIDSRPVLEEVAGNEEVPRMLTKEFTESYKIWPYTLIKTAMKCEEIDNPPIGAYWVGTDNHARAFTWLRAIAGAEMKVMKRKKLFNLEVVDKKPYGRNISVRVQSRQDKDRNYEFSINRLPLSRKRDIRQYSSWIDLSHNSNDPDARYRGEEHDKRVHPVYVFSASTIAAFYEIMTFVARHPSWRQFRINPFPIPRDKAMVDYVDNLRLGSIIFTKEGKLSVLNKTSIDRLIGARIIEKGYDNCFYHWGKKKDTGYLVNV